MEIKTRFSIGDHVERYGSEYNSRGYVDSITIYVEEDKVETFYHFDGGSFSEDEISLVDEEKDKRELESIKKRISKLKQMLKNKRYSENEEFWKEYDELYERYCYLK